MVVIAKVSCNTDLKSQDADASRMVHVTLIIDPLESVFQSQFNSLTTVTTLLTL
jgi:hypothetical protein